MPTKERPVKEIRRGRIKAVIWGNETEKGTRYNVQLRRIYKEGDKWEQSDSFGVDDLLVVAKVADEAYSFITDDEKEES